MELLNELLQLLEHDHPKDFFHAMTKLSRVFKGYPQEYGFHHHHDKGEFHGTFVTRDARGRVEKQEHSDGSAVYTCIFDENNLHDDLLRHEQVLDAVRASSPSHWDFLPQSTYKKCEDPCFTVVSGKNRTVEIHVKHDFHPSIR